MEEKLLGILRKEIKSIKLSIKKIDLIIGMDAICAEENDELKEYLDGDKMEE